MAIYSCVKCISCLLKTLKIMHCVKKALTAVICLVVVAMGLTMLTENKKAVRGMIKTVKKKVL